MANRRCSVWVYKKVNGRWRYVKPLVGRNNKIKPEPEVSYYIRWYEGSKTRWQKCSSAAAAVNACERQEAYLNAAAHRSSNTTGILHPRTSCSPRMLSRGWRSIGCRTDLSRMN